LFTYGIDVWQLRNRLLLWCVNGAQLIITISRFTRVALIHGCGVPAHRIRVLPNCIDQSTTHGEARHIDEINARFTLPGKKVLLTVGRLSAKERYKGHDRVIRQLAKLILRIPNVCYLIVGDGDDRLRLEALVEQLAVSEYVVFAGELDSDWLQAMYARADVFTMPSTGEGFGFVYLEAMSAGLPIVALDAAGTPDALAHSEDSYLVAADDDDALLDALTVCLCRTSHRQRAPRTAAIAPFSRKRFTVQLGTIMATVPPIV
jgi:glycosyltransferase involved in cell wall biosynthesis